MTCKHFASGCNAPEGECLGLCLKKPASIEQIALEVEDEMPADELTNVKHRLPEFLRRCLAKIGAGLEPVATKQVTQQFNCFHVDSTDFKKLEALPVGAKLYTTPAEAILAVEQRVAEAITKMIADKKFSFEQSELWRLRTELVLAIRSGAWREYL